MKKFKSIIVLLLFNYLMSVAAETDEFYNKYHLDFKRAYGSVPTLPKGILEAVSYTNTRFEHIPETESSDTDFAERPKIVGIMGLIRDGKGYFRNNLDYISELSGIDDYLIINDPEYCIKAYALALSKIAHQKMPNPKDITDYIDALIDISELPNKSLQNDFATGSFIYSVVTLLNDNAFQKSCGLPLYKIDLQEIFGANYKLLSAKYISYEDQQLYGTSLSKREISNPCNDFGGALWDPSPNFGTRNGTPISAVTIHVTEGSYAGAIAWLKNPTAQVSAHYVLRSSDGQITQLVCEKDKAWHARAENIYTVGLEHEGFVNKPEWLTDTMYKASALLVKDICKRNNINPLNTYYGKPSSKLDLLPLCTAIKGHQHFPNNTHTDPGINWNWNKYYRFINDSFSIDTIVGAQGVFYDKGGAHYGYGNNERSFWLIKAGSNISLTFSKIRLETDRDMLFIYDGDEITDTPLSIITGIHDTLLTFTSSKGTMLVEFRSNCDTIDSGWVASWKSVNTSSKEFKINNRTGISSNSTTFFTGVPFSKAILSNAQGRTIGTLLADDRGVLDFSTMVRAYPGILFISYKRKIIGQVNRGILK